MKNNLKLSVSNIAWESNLDAEVAKFLRNSNILHVELALTRYQSDISQMSKFEALQLQGRWAQLGIEISSLQSLLFNQPELQLFGNSNSRLRMKELLLHVSKLAALLNAKAMVLGAPKNRVRGLLEIAIAKVSAANFFRELDAKWPSKENFLALEANPEVYGCDFLTKTSEAINFVHELSLKSLQWHLDTACTELGGESVVDLILNAATLPSHVHLSETNLGPLKIPRLNHYKEIFQVLRNRNYCGFVVLEMRDTGDLKRLFESIELMLEASRT